MRLKDITPATWIAIGLGLRMILLGWGTFQDINGPLPYTDIDYKVFTSAASLMYDDCPVQLIAAQEPEEEYENLIDPPLAKGRCAQGYIPAASRLMIQMEKDFLMMNEDIDVTHPEDSIAHAMTDLVPTIYKAFKPIFRLLAGLGNPYKRETYRYTPLLALILTPAEALADNGYWPDLVQGLYGKLLFVLADILVALLLWDTMDLRNETQSSNFKASETHGWLVGLLWLANPFAAQISTRGSSESVLGVLVLAFVDATIRGYPEHYLPTIAARRKGKKPSIAGYLPDPSRWSNERVLAPFLFALAIHWKLYPIIYAAALVPHLMSSESFRAVIRYGAISLYSLALICGSVYALWGLPYIQETFFYHLNRTDHRHNFSPFFLPAYLSTNLPISLSENEHLVDLFQSMQPILGFIPQLLATAYIGFSIGGQDLIAAFTFQTMAFVALNKVCTSQYFMWFLWFLPLLGPHLSFSGGKRELFILIGIWVAVQALWLSQAYLLEFKALDTFTRTWLASLTVLAVHAFLLIRLINAWALARLQAQTVAEKASKNGKQKPLPASIEEEKE